MLHRMGVAYALHNTFITAFYCAQKLIWDVYELCLRPGRLKVIVIITRKGYPNVGVHS